MSYSWSRNLCLRAVPLFLAAMVQSVGAQPAPSSSGREIMAGDRLRITVNEAPDMNREYAVAGDGTVDFPVLGRVMIESLTTDQAADFLAEQLKTKYFKAAHVTIEVAEYVEGSILLFGEVVNPGSVDTRGDRLVTLMEVLAGAGGLTDRAAADQVHILRWKPGGRMERETIIVNVKDMLERADFSRDQYLRPRDIIFVPSKKGGEGSAEFLALGEFGNPGFKAHSEGMDIIRAVVAAGGVNRDGRMEAARLLRRTTGGEYDVIPIDLGRLFGNAEMSMNVPVFPGDILFVPSAGSIVGGRVYFLGAVARPGAITLPASGDATLARTILNQIGFNKYANQNKVKIIRRAPNGSRQEMVVDVGEILESGDFSRDVPLQDEDVVMVSESIFTF